VNAPPDFEQLRESQATGQAVVSVLWRDAYYEYEGDGEGHTDYLVVTVGHLISDGPTFLAVASERLPDLTYRAITFIPRESVLELAYLQEGTEP
jgi:hypothetical protein